MYDYILLAGIALAAALLFAGLEIYDRWPRKR
jgi:hypothetical protein